MLGWPHTFPQNGKDLNELFAKGKVNRIYGGATLIRSYEEPLLERRKRNLANKQRIGAAAAELIHDGDSLFIDNGTTTEQLAASLQACHRVSVITTGLNIANTLRPFDEVTVYLPEGRMDHSAYSIVGAQTEASLEKYNARLSFIGIDGLTVEQGLLNNSYEASAISQIMLRNSGTKVLLADSSKFGNIGSISLCPISGIDIVITDSDISETYRNAFIEAGVRIIIA